MFLPDRFTDTTDNLWVENLNAYNRYTFLGEDAKKEMMGKTNRIVYVIKGTQQDLLLRVIHLIVYEANNRICG